MSIKSTAIAAVVLRARNLSSEQAAYLAAHTVPNPGTAAATSAPQSTPQATQAPFAQSTPQATQAPSAQSTLKAETLRVIGPTSGISHVLVIQMNAT